jgi:hypothetical protein
VTSLGLERHHRLPVPGLAIVEEALRSRWRSWWGTADHRHTPTRGAALHPAGSGTWPRPGRRDRARRAARCTGYTRPAWITWGQAQDRHASVMPPSPPLMSDREPRVAASCQSPGGFVRGLRTVLPSGLQRPRTSETRYAQNVPGLRRCGALSALRARVVTTVGARALARGLAVGHHSGTRAERRGAICGQGDPKSSVARARPGERLLGPTPGCCKFGH